MFRHLGHHLVKKYNHSLIVDKIYDDKPTRTSQVLTSTSSRQSKDKELGLKNRNQQSNKKTRNIIFSPHQSLRKYREKQRSQSLQNTYKNDDNEVTLLISAINQNQKIQKRSITPIKQLYKESHACSICLLRQKHQNQRKTKQSTEQQNPQFNQTENNINQTMQKRLKYSNRIFIIARRQKGTKTAKLASRSRQNCCHHLQLPVAGQFKPWDMNNSQSSF